MHVKRHLEIRADFSPTPLALSARGTASHYVVICGAYNMADARGRCNSQDCNILGSEGISPIKWRYARCRCGSVNRLQGSHVSSPQRLPMPCHAEHKARVTAFYFRMRRLDLHKEYRVLSLWAARATVGIQKLMEMEDQPFRGQIDELLKGKLGMASTLASCSLCCYGCRSHAL